MESKGYMCPRCNAEVNERDKMCRHCRSDLENVEKVYGDVVTFWSAPWASDSEQVWSIDE